MTAPSPVAPPVFPRRRPWLRPVLLGLGGIVTVIVLFWATVSVAATMARTSEHIERTFEGRITAVEVRTEGSVEIVTGPTGGARSDLRLRYALARPKVTQGIDGRGVLRVKVSCTGISVWCSSSLDLRVPADVPTSVRADTVRISDVTGPVTVEAAAGEVQLTRLGGVVRVNLGAGEIRGDELSSAEVDASVGAGSVRLAFVEPPRNAKAQAGAGEAEIVLPGGPTTYLVETSAGAGEASPQVPSDPGSSRTVRAETGAGRAVVRYANR